VATTYALLLVGAAVVGVSSGLYPAAALAWLSNLFKERRGRAFGINTAAIDTGSALSPGVATAVLVIGTWRTAFAPIAVVMATVFVYVHRWGREPYVLERFSLDVGKTARVLISTKRMRWTLVCYSLYMFTWQGIAGFLPTCR
jgi:MFS family permease